MTFPLTLKIMFIELVVLEELGEFFIAGSNTIDVLLTWMLMYINLNICHILFNYLNVPK